MSQEYFYWVLGREVGPVSAAAIYELVAEGRCSLTDRIRDGNGNWIDVKVVCEHAVSENPQAFANHFSRPRSSSERTNPAPQSEMRQLIAECVQKQKKRHGNVGERRRNSRQSGFRSAGASIGLIIHSTFYAFISAALFFASSIWWLFFAILFQPVHFFAQRAPGTTGSLKILRRVRGTHVLAIAASVVVAAGFFLAWRTESFWMTQAKLCGELDRIWAKHELLRSKGGNAEEWGEFQWESSERLAVLTPIAQSMAKTDDRVSLALLWVTRDYLPLIVEDGPATDDTLQRSAKAQLSFARSALSARTGSAISMNSREVAIVGLDLCVILLLGWRFRDVLIVKWMSH